MEVGLCQCGCGNKTPINKRNVYRRGTVKGEPARFIEGHNFGGSRENHPRWKGGKKKRENSYISVLMPDHPRAADQGYVREHILVAEKVLGKALPFKAVIHHINEQKSDNQAKNLVICQDNIYHMLLHQRLRAYHACGHAHWRKCSFCKKYDAPDNLKFKKTSAYHSECHNKHQNSRRNNRRAICN